jgi:predicted transcriptional regulator
MTSSVQRGQVVDDTKRFVMGKSAMRAKLKDSEWRPNGRRGEIAILAEILSLAAMEAGQTKIMYSCNLSYQGMRSYLKALETKGLVKANRAAQSPRFRTTAKGKRLLSSLEEALALLQ